MKCCYSCLHWDSASKKVPIDVRKVPVKDQFIELSIGGKPVKMQAWDWTTTRPIELREILRKRICFKGKGIVEPWDECDNYASKSPEQTSRCRSCDYSGDCLKARNLTKYIA